MVTDANGSGTAGVKTGVKMHSEFCIICKEIVNQRYILKAKDSRLNIGLKALVCRHCFNKLFQSKQNKGYFRISKLMSWVKEKRDSMRLF